MGRPWDLALGIRDVDLLLPLEDPAEGFDQLLERGARPPVGQCDSIAGREIRLEILMQALCDRCFTERDVHFVVVLE
jgi:hypothetical protein